MSQGCVFCDQSWMREAETVFELTAAEWADTRDLLLRAQVAALGDQRPGKQTA